MGFIINPYRYASAGGITDLTSYSPTAAYSFSRNLLSGYGGARYSDTGGAITTLNDQAGSARNLTDDGASTRPTLSTAGPNSIACGDFDGATDYLIGPDWTNFYGYNDKYLIVSCILDAITVATSANWKSDGHYIFGDSITGITASVDSGTDTVFAHMYISGSSDTFTSQAVTEGTPYVFALRHEGGNAYLSVNGGTETSFGAIANFAGAGVLRLGLHSAFMDGKIFEAATWSAVPNATDRAAIIDMFLNHIT